MNYLLQKYNAKKARTDGVSLNSFRAGDKVVVSVEIDQTGGTAIQKFEGLCIATRRSSISSTFVVRKTSDKKNIGVERMFTINDPRVKHIEKLQSHKTRRSKLYYIRELSGKSARLKVVR